MTAATVRRVVMASLVWLFGAVATGTTLLLLGLDDTDGWPVVLINGYAMWLTMDATAAAWRWSKP